MTSYEVTCQDESGRKVTVTVKADTDEKACVAALKTLNSWLAVKALPIDKVPLRIEIASSQEKPVEPPAFEEAERPLTGRIVHRATVVDWIDLNADRVRRLGSVGAALLEARERVAA